MAHKRVRHSADEPTSFGSLSMYQAIILKKTPNKPGNPVITYIECICILLNGLIKFIRYRFQIVQLLRGNIGCFENKRLRRIPFFRKAFEDGRDQDCIENSNMDLIRHRRLVFESEAVVAA